MPKPLRPKSPGPRYETFPEFVVRHFRAYFSDPRLRKATVYMLVGGVVAGIFVKVIVPLWGVAPGWNVSTLIYLAIILFLTVSIIEGFRQSMKKAEDERNLYKDLPEFMRTLSVDELDKEIERLKRRDTIKALIQETGRDLFKTAQTLHQVDKEERELKHQFPKLKQEIHIMAEVKKMHIKEKHR